MSRPVAAAWGDACLAACLCALAPAEFGGVVVRAGPGAVRDAWLAALTASLPPETPFKRVPLHASDSRILGGLDLCATLAAGRPVSERGILQQAHGGFVLLSMAERLSLAAAARFMHVVDMRQVVVERDGLSGVYASHIGIIAFDESDEDEPGIVEGLKDRLAFHVDLRAISSRDLMEFPWSRNDLAEASLRYGQVEIDDTIIDLLCKAALAHGIESLRATLLVCRTAKGLAALQGRMAVTEDDAACAARLVLAPRARMRPSQQESSDAAAADQPSEAFDQDASSAKPSTQESAAQDAATGNSDAHEVSPADKAAEPASERKPAEAEEKDTSSEAPSDTILAAIASALPAGLLAQSTFKSSAPKAQSSASSGRSGSAIENLTRGRPVGSRRGDLSGKARLHLLETLRAAAPWQALRRQQLATSPGTLERARIQVRREDFYIRRFVQRAQTTTIFVVDASGSSALHRLAEAKGAVEQLLAECYIRRDRVAVLGFRHHSAELILPPTRSLVRAKRSLAAMPASGGTPLASAIDAGAALADAVRRHGDTPFIVLLSDGRANVARDGSHDRVQARSDALSAAGAMRAAQLSSLFVDTSPRTSPEAHHVAQSMGAQYVALPYVDSNALCSAIRTAMQ